MTTDRDPVVGGVLDLLPVEPPADRFWVDLSTRLRAERPSPLLRPVPPEPEAEPASGSGPAALRRTPPRGPAATAAAYRRRRLVAGLVAGLVAAAVAAGAVLAVGALRDDGRDTVDVGPLDPSSTTAPSDATSTTAPGAATGPAGGTTPAAGSAARQVALDWIAAIDRGDADGAWALVGPQSREQIGGRDAFDDLMASALREGWGAWSQAGVTVTPAPVEPLEGTATWAVTFAGTIAQEGSTEHRAVVLLVRGVGDELRVEPFLPGAALDLVDPALTRAGAPAVAPGAVLGLVVDADRRGAVVAIDGEPLAPADLVVDEDGAVRGARVPDLPAGPHALTVAVVTSSGALAAVAQTFTVA